MCFEMLHKIVYRMSSLFRSLHQIKSEDVKLVQKLLQVRFHCVGPPFTGIF